MVSEAEYRTHTTDNSLQHYILTVRTPNMVPALSLVALSLSFGTYAFTTEPLSIGPVADLPIVNKEIAPDGFSRAAVLAGGTFPGPLIVGHKVVHSCPSSEIETEVNNFNNREIHLICM